MNNIAHTKIAKARSMTIALLLATVTLMIIESTTGHHKLLPSNALLIWMAAKSLPLLAFIPAILSLRTRPLAWMGFVILFYMLVAAMQAFEPGISGYLAIARCVLLSATLITSSFLVRWLAQSSGDTGSHATPSS